MSTSGEALIPDSNVRSEGDARSKGLLSNSEKHDKRSCTTSSSIRNLNRVHSVCCLSFDFLSLQCVCILLTLFGLRVFVGNWSSLVLKANQFSFLIPYSLCTLSAYQVTELNKASLS